MPSLRIALAAVATTLAAAAPAAADTNPYTPVGVCGGAFHVIDQHDLRGPQGGLLGTTYLLWDGGSQRNCAVTIKRRAVGIPTFVEASLAKTGGGYKADNSLGYRYYAGPVYVKAPGTCVIFGGRMTDAQGNGDSWITPQPIHCN